MERIPRYERRYKEIFTNILVSHGTVQKFSTAATQMGHNLLGHSLIFYSEGNDFLLLQAVTIIYLLDHNHNHNHSIVYICSLFICKGE